MLWIFGFTFSFNIYLILEILDILVRNLKTEKHILSNFNCTNFTQSKIKKHLTPSTMVKLGLQISARLENVEKIDVCGEDFRYYIKTLCCNCGESSGSGDKDKWQYVSINELTEGRTGSRNAECHMKMKCKGCQREISLLILEDSVKSYTFDEDKPEGFQTIAIFEGRGMEVTDFDFRGGWKIKALNSSTVFENVDLTDRDWADYDEKSGDSVAIYETKCQIVKLKT